MPSGAIQKRVSRAVQASTDGTGARLSFPASRWDGRTSMAADKEAPAQPVGSLVQREGGGLRDGVHCGDGAADETEREVAGRAIAQREMAVQRQGATKDVAPSGLDRAETLRGLFAKVDEEIVGDMNCARDLDSPDAGRELLALSDAELKKLGWRDRRQLRVAIDGKTPAKEEPAYLRHAADRATARVRNEEPQRAVNAALVVVLPDAAGAHRRPRHIIDVDEA